VQFAPKQAVPIFPLPEVVLFPHAVLPLHIFELRYRTMVREALSAERMIVLAVLLQGWDRDYFESPAFHGLGCLARFEEVEWLPNDCYDLKVLGLSRVRIGKPVQEYPYRSARVQLVPQAPHPEDDPLVDLERRALIEAFARLARHAAPAASPELERASQLPFEALVNRICMAVTPECDRKLTLLEMDSVLERSQRTREIIEERLRKPPETPPQAAADN
jgi:Lon protease-like protein